jgi:UDP-galactopyranose mutase
MFTFNKLWGVNTPEEAKIKIESQSIVTDNPLNFEEQAISTIGRDIYEKLIKGYSQKQWRKDPKDLPKEIIKRLPIRYTWDNNYYHDTYQGIPIGGYTQIFEKLLNGIEVRLSTDYFDNREYFNSISKKIIYTGAIDKFYDYKFGHLEYKTVNFEHKYISHTDNFQGCSVMNYTDLETPYTRIIEHKHFENNQTNGTWVTWEYPIEYDAKRTEAYYPVNDRVNNEKYNSYKELSNKESNIFFGGRLAEYKYYDMDDIIESALRFIENHIK